MCQWSLIYFLISVLAAHLPFLASLNLVRPYNTAGLGSRILSPRSFYGFMVNGSDFDESLLLAPIFGITEFA